MLLSVSGQSQKPALLSSDELGAKVDETNDPFITAPFPEPEVVAQSLAKAAKGSASVCTAWTPYKPGATPENPCKVLSEASPTTPARTLDASFSKWAEPEASSPSSDELEVKVG
jgi:hypothetical protein